MIKFSVSVVISILMLLEEAALERGASNLGPQRGTELVVFGMTPINATC